MSSKTLVVTADGVRSVIKVQNGLALPGGGTGPHSHVSVDITDLVEFIQDNINSALEAGTGLSKVYDDTTGKVTLTNTSLGSQNGSLDGNTGTFRYRRMTSAEFTTANPVLQSGEPGWEINTGRIKTGDGTTAWNGLPYWDALTRARANHTGTQLASTISDLTEAVEDLIGTRLVGGTNVTVSYDDEGTGRTTISAESTAPTALDASVITTGVFARARLGSGTANGTTFLRGDGQWGVPGGSSGGNLDSLSDAAISSPVLGQMLWYDGSNFVNRTVVLHDIEDVHIPARFVDENGNVIEPGPQAGTYLGYDDEHQDLRLMPIEFPEWPEPPPPQWFLPQIIVPVGETVPVEFPDGGLVHDENFPDAPLIEPVNTVAASTATQTIPPVTTATVHDITLSANCNIVLPTPVAGASFWLALRQPASGAVRTVTYSGGALKWPAPGTQPALSTTNGAVDIITFVCVAGSWRGSLPEKYTS